MKVHKDFYVVLACFLVLFLLATEGYSQAPCPDPVMIAEDGFVFNTIQGAYDDASLRWTDFTLLLVSETFTEDLIIDDGSVLLDGGYDCSFSTKNLSTGILGSITISAGTVTFDNIGLLSPPVCAFDSDGDGFTSIGSCTGSADDCNDNNANVFPGNPEVCDGLDNNCDGQIDEGLSAVDADNDGYSAEDSCGGSADDCNDNDAGINPGAVDIPYDGIDQDCSGADLTFAGESCVTCHAPETGWISLHDLTTPPDGTCATCHAAPVNNVLSGHYGKTVRSDGNNMTAGSTIVCGSCHDADSNTHGGGVALGNGSNFVTNKITAVYPDITCDTCHENRAALHSSAHSVEVGPNDLSYNPPGTLCSSCHVVADWSEIEGIEHNVSTNGADSCSTCHDSPRAEVQITIAAGTPPIHCLDCHSDKDLTPHHGPDISGTDCESCHGHDNGYEYSPGLFSLGAGSFQSHSTHTEGDIDDLKGPHLSCDTCHDTANYPFFNSGVQINGDGFFDLSETDVCDACHSAGGTYDGVDDPVIGAKTSWTTGVYTDTGSAVLSSGKEKWCAGCHDESPAIVNGISAPNVVGDETGSYTYGTGWGFYKTGHGLDSATTYPASGGLTGGAGVGCDACHDYSLSHVDSDARTYSAAGDNYQEGYRLKLVNGLDPMLVPRPSGPSSINPDDFRLCFGCHDPAMLTENYESLNLATNFRTDSPARNYHQYHIYMNQAYFDSEWETAPATYDSKATCITCHNVHGSTQLAMMRDGKLVDREPGLITYYSKDGTTVSNPPAPPAPPINPVTLLESDAMLYARSSTRNICGSCHGSGDYSKYYRAIPGPQQIPALDWTGEPSYTADGVDPDTGFINTRFTFRVSYSDANYELPSPIEVWVDENSNSIYEPGEKHAMGEVDGADWNTADGKLYSMTMNFINAAEGVMTYRFYASDGTADATGLPTGDQTIVISNNAPTLDWVGSGGFVSDGAEPDSAASGSSFEFQIMYTDADEDPPSVIELWLDKNDDTDYLDVDEKVSMAEFNTFDTDVRDGKIYYAVMPLVKAGDTQLSYRFYAADSVLTATGAPTTDRTVTVANNVPSLSWTGEPNYTVDGIDPDSVLASGSFEFRITYTDADNEAPTVMQVWVDEDDSSTYEPGEKYPLLETDGADSDHTDGKQYSATLPLAHAGDGTLIYRFYGTDGSDDAIGPPVTDAPLHIYTSNNAPDLDWTGENGFTVDGVEPDTGSGGAQFTFQVKYTDIDNTGPVSIQVWVDKNDDGDYLDALEQVDMSALDGDTVYADGKFYTAATIVPTVADNGVVYLFYAHDGTDPAGGNATAAQTVTVISPTTVCASGCGFTTIQAAIDDVATINGDYVLVDDGVYSENITFSGKDITVQSINGPSFTTIQGSGANAPVVTFAGGESINAVLDGFTIDNQAVTDTLTRGIYISGSEPTITNAVVQGNSVTGDGAGIYIDGPAAGAVINDSIIGGSSPASGNVSSANGGGIYYANSSTGTLSISNCEIRYNQANNAASGGGAGLYLAANTNPATVTDSIISDNAAVFDGGGICMANSTLTVDNSQIDNNAALNNGGGIYFADSAVGTLIINDSTITLNSGRYGGGLYLLNLANATTVSNTTISSNTANYDGGGIFTSASPTSIADSRVTDNTSSATYGGGIYFRTTGDISNTSVDNNYAGQGGGGIAMRGGTTATNLTFAGGTIDGNVAPNAGGGVYVYGGGLISFSKTQIRGNHSREGGGVYLMGAGDVTLENCTVTGNIADYSGVGRGGGVYAYPVDWGNVHERMTIRSSTVSGNYALNQGGGVYAIILYTSNSAADDGVEVSNSIVWGNTAGDPLYPGIYVHQNRVNLIIDHSDVELIGSMAGFIGTNNIDIDPMFVDMQQSSAGTPTTAGDFHLLTGSSCIDSGSVTNAPVDDMDGDARPLDVLGKGDGVDDYDMGSDEFMP